MAARQNVNAFPKTFRLADFEEFDVNVTDTQWTTVYKLDVEKGLAYHFGRGQDSTQDGAQGRIFAQIQNSTPTALSGQVRISVFTRQMERVDVISQFDLDEIGIGENARGDRYPFPNANRYEGYPYVVGIELKLEDGSGTDTVSTADSDLKADGMEAQKFG